MCGFKSSHGVYKMESNQRNSRSLSEEYYSRSPNSRILIMGMTQTIPTSKYKKEYTNMDEYKNASEEKKQFMIAYQMIPERVILTETKKKST